EDALRRDAIAPWLNAGRYAAVRADVRRDDGHGHAHADPAIRAFCIQRERPVAQAGLYLWLNLLAGLRGSRLLRGKGLINVEGKPVVVHAVQTLIDEPVTLERWPDAEQRSRLVFITQDMSQQEIERTLGALDYAGPTAAATGAFDAEAYARFVGVAAN